MSFHSLKSKSTRTSTFIHRLPQFLVPLAILLSIYLYLYPVFFGCVFPSIDGSLKTAYRDTVEQHRNTAHVNPLDTRPHLAPFRLLVLADPQLEGDSSLPDPEDAFERKIVKHWTRLGALSLNNSAEAIDMIQDIVSDLILNDIPNALRAARKRIDLFGNDYYLAHIFRTLHWWTKPTHVTVLGDLIGSQWVDDEEFEWRGWRYWNRVFAGGRRVDDEIMEFGRQGGGISIRMDDPAWRTRIVNIVGNHDIGYAGDITRARMDRFEKMYGKANWDLRFEYPVSRMSGRPTGVRPMLHMVVLNSMLLDTPPMDESLQTENYNYLNDLIVNRMAQVEDRTDFTLLLTHVPLYKKEGTCVDAPYFDFWNEDDCSAGDCKPGGVKEQNHLSDSASQPGMLQAIFGFKGDLDGRAQGKGRPGLVLTGHDHAGCDVWHYIPKNSTYKGSERVEGSDEEKTLWEVSRWKQADMSSAHTGVREVTLRSMMGEFAGNAGLLSAWFDFDEAEWKYDIQMCKLGVQHVWWAVHVIDLLAIVSVLLSGLTRILQPPTKGDIRKRPGNKSMKIE